MKIERIFFYSVEFEFKLSHLARFDRYFYRKFETFIDYGIVLKDRIVSLIDNCFIIVRKLNCLWIDNSFRTSDVILLMGSSESSNFETCHKNRIIKRITFESLTIHLACTIFDKFAVIWTTIFSSYVHI